MATPWPAACQASVLYQLPELVQTYPFLFGYGHDAIQPYRVLCHLLLLPSIFSSIKVFSSELALHIRWPKHWSFSFSTSPSSEYSGLIFFRMDWFGGPLNPVCSPSDSPTLRCAGTTWRTYSKRPPDFTPRACDLVGLEWSLRVCISNKCPGGADVAGPGTTF